MIFVTVGTGKFDDLVKRIDEDVLNGKITDDVLIQIGHGVYIPKKCEYFRFKPCLDEYYEMADLIITHGGAGTTFEILSKGKKLIGVPHPHLPDEHQMLFLKYLSDKQYMIYCEDLQGISRYVSKIKSIELKRYVKPKCNIPEKIYKFLEYSYDVKWG